MSYSHHFASIVAVCKFLPFKTSSLQPHHDMAPLEPNLALLLIMFKVYLKYNVYMLLFGADQKLNMNVMANNVF